LKNFTCDVILYPNNAIVQVVNVRDQEGADMSEIPGNFDDADRTESERGDDTADRIPGSAVSPADVASKAASSAADIRGFRGRYAAFPTDDDGEPTDSVDNAGKLDVIEPVPGDAAIAETVDDRQTARRSRRPWPRPRHATPPQVMDHEVRVSEQQLAATYVRELASIALDKQALIAGGREVDDALEERLAQDRILETQRRHANRAFIVGSAQALESQLPSRGESTWPGMPRFDADTLCLTSAESWIALRANTVFFVPPKDSRLGLETVYRYDFSPEAIYRARNSKTAPKRELSRDHRPVPAVLVGHTVDDVGKKSERHQYLALVPSAQLDEVQVEAGHVPSLTPSTGSPSEFSLVGLHTKKPLQYPDAVPTEKEVHDATWLRPGSYTFKLLRSTQEATSLPRVTVLDTTTYRYGISDSDMERFDVLGRVNGLLTEFGKPDLLDPLLAKLVAAR